jgi:hypothetical protein
MEAAGGDIVVPVMASQPSTLSFAGHVTIERACRHGPSAHETHPDRPYGITIDGEYFSLQSHLFLRCASGASAVGKGPVFVRTAGDPTAGMSGP